MYFNIICILVIAYFFIVVFLFLEYTWGRVDLLVWWRLCLLLRGRRRSVWFARSLRTVCAARETRWNFAAAAGFCSCRRCLCCCCCLCSLLVGRRSSCWRWGAASCRQDEWRNGLNVVVKERALPTGSAALALCLPVCFSLFSPEFCFFFFSVRQRSQLACWVSVKVTSALRVLAFFLVAWACAVVAVVVVYL